MNKNILIHGGSSVLSKYLVKFYYENTDKFYIFSRNINRTKKNILFSKYSKKKFIFYKANLNNLKQTITKISSLHVFFDGVFWITGHIGNPTLEFKNIKQCKKNFDINFTNTIISINLLSKKVKKNSKSFICVFTSVAGLRGRKKRLFYCAAKSGLISYLSGLRQYYYKKINVVTVIPGYMNTNKFNIKAPKLLVTAPEKVIKIIIDGIKKKKELIYINFFWRIVMFFIFLIPEKIFKRLNF